MTAPTGRGRGSPRVAQWRKPAHPIWLAPPTVMCRGEDTSLFYRADNELPGERAARTEKARELCSWCHAAAECLETAMAEEKSGGSRFGIRGGLTPEERKNLQVKRTLIARKARERAEREKETAA